MEETKLDKVLSQVLTISGQMTILQGQVKTMQGQMNVMQGQMNVMQEQMNTMQGQMDKDHKEFRQRFDKIEKEHKEFREETKERFDKIEEDHKEFKKGLDLALEHNFRLRDRVITKHTKEIKKLQHKPSAIIADAKARLKKFISKTN